MSNSLRAALIVFAFVITLFCSCSSSSGKGSKLPGDWPVAELTFPSEATFNVQKDDAEKATLGVFWYLEIDCDGDWEKLTSHIEKSLAKAGYLQYWQEHPTEGDNKTNIRTYISSDGFKHILLSNQMVFDTKYKRDSGFEFRLVLTEQAKKAGEFDRAGTVNSKGYKHMLEPLK